MTQLLQLPNSLPLTRLSYRTVIKLGNYQAGYQMALDDVALSKNPAPLICELLDVARTSTLASKEYYNGMLAALIPASASYSIS